MSSVATSPAGLGPQLVGPGPSAAQMKLEMPRSFTDHPLSRKVEQLKSYANIYLLEMLYMLEILQRCYWQVQSLSEDKSLHDSEVQLK